MPGDIFLGTISGLYTIRMIWSHGHRKEAYAIFAAAILLNLIGLYSRRR